MEIEAEKFGEIEIDGETYDHDVVVLPDEIIERKKWITKNQHGTSHRFTREEMKEYLSKVEPPNIKKVIVGTGHFGKLGLLEEARDLLEEFNIEAMEFETPEAAKIFLEDEASRGQKIGIFHVTC